MTVHSDPIELAEEWSLTPWWLIYLSTLPSALLWLSLIINGGNALLAIVFILTFGVPTKLLHHTFKVLCQLKSKPPSNRLHLLFFAGQLALYTMVIMYVVQT
jgi:hypothetical protein